MKREQPATASPPPALAERATAAASSRRAALAGVVASYLLVAVVALVFRTHDLGGFVNEDEARYWLDRSYTFLNALEEGQPADTAISTHPGVTTMWSGSTGTVLKRKLLEWGLLEAAPFPVTLALMRLPAALVHTLGVLVGYALLRRMLPAAMALLAALLWATDPLTLALSRWLHVDALMATFSMVSILAAAYYWHHRRHPALLLLSAACAALAVLSKSPGLVVPPFVAGIALTAFVWPPPPQQRQALPGALGALVAWGVVFALTLVAVWPAVWADPQRVYELLRIGVEVEGGSPHVQGNFFLGRAQDEPGWPFYPVAVALRLTPWAMIGLLLLPLVWHWLTLERASRRDLLVLVCFAILFTVALSIFPKKLNRYIMPIFPALNILAAVGLVGTVDLLARLWRGSAQHTRLLQGGRWLLAGLVGLVAIVNAAHWHPYGIAYFNQVLGGARAGPETFLIGTGEGLEQAADWLNEQPDITGVVVATTMKPALQPYLKHGAQSSSRNGTDLPRATGYVVVYVRNIWGGAVPPFDRFYQQVPPLHTINIHGVEYAWIYQVPPPIANELAVSFGPDIELRGYELDRPDPDAAGSPSLTLLWYADAPVETDYLMFAHVLDAQGQRISQIDAPPAGPDAPTGSWEPGRYVTWRHPLPLPADLPPGDYWLALGLYHPETFARLPVNADPPTGAPDAGGNALLLPIELE